VVRVIHNIDDDTYFLKLRFHTSGPRLQTIVIPRSKIASPKGVQEQLLDKGANIDFNNAAGFKQIKEALRKPPFKGRIQKTGLTGWHDDSFVWQGGTHGPLHGKLRFRTDEAVDKAELGRGMLDTWRSGLEAPCQSSRILVFALAMGFAAPFLKFVSPNGGATFYIWGETTTGKTLASRALVSIFRRAEENDLMTFDLTDSKLDEEAQAYNDLALVLNESEYLDDTPDARAAIMRKIAYKLAGGVGRQRSKAATKNLDLKNKKWRTMCLGSGETTAVRTGRKGGEKIRLIDIPVPEPHLGGIFDQHDPDVSDPVVAGGVMAQAVEQTISENYGVAFAPFMEAVCADLSATITRLKRNVSFFLEKVAPGADAKTRRMVMKFGLVYAGAIEACNHEIAPWTKERAGVAIAHVCRLALKRTVAERFIVESAIQKLQAAVQNPQLFPIVEKGQSLPPNLVGHAMGFRRSGQSGKFVAVRSEDLAKIIGGSEIAAKVLDRLANEKILLMDGDKRVRKVQVQGFGEVDRDRWYCFWYDEYRTHDQRYKAKFLKTSEPTSLPGIEKYLGSGMIRGIGPVYAKKLVRAFGEKVFDTIEAEPERLREVTGIGPVRADRITVAWAEQKIVREIMVFLHSHGRHSAGGAHLQDLRRGCRAGHV